MRDFWRGEVTLRKIRVLIEGLPPDSAVHRAVLDHNWTHDRDWILADVADTLRQLLVLTANINRAGNQAPIPAPEMLPRPGQESRITQEEEAEERAAHRRRVAALLPGRK